MPTTEDEERYNAEYNKIIAERGACLTLFIVIVSTLLCLAAGVFIWGWLVSNGGL